MNRYADIPIPRPLIYAPEIYWLMPHEYVEMGVADEIIRRGYGNIRAEIDHTLTHAALERMAGTPYTKVEEIEERSQEAYRIYRWHLYERPGFYEIKRFRMPSIPLQFRIPVIGEQPITLDLRRLSDHGRIVGGALHEGILYIVEEVS